MQDYLTLQKFRFEDRLLFQLQIMIDDQAMRDLYTPKFLLQPIVENAIKYGLEARKGLEVHITVSEEFSAKSGNRDMVFRIRDNGPGIPPEKLEQLELTMREGAFAAKDSGFGLGNVNARIMILHGHDYGVQLHSHYGMGTEVSIRIPILTAFEAADR